MAKSKETDYETLKTEQNSQNQNDAPSQFTQQAAPDEEGSPQDTYQEEPVRRESGVKPAPYINDNPSPVSGYSDTGAPIVGDPYAPAGPDYGSGGGPIMPDVWQQGEPPQKKKADIPAPRREYTEEELANMPDHGASLQAQNEPDPNYVPPGMEEDRYGKIVYSAKDQNGNPNPYAGMTVEGRNWMQRQEGTKEGRAKRDRYEQEQGFTPQQIMASRRIRQGRQTPEGQVSLAGTRAGADVIEERGIQQTMMDRPGYVADKGGHRWQRGSGQPETDYQKQAKQMWSMAAWARRADLQSLGNIPQGQNALEAYDKKFQELVNSMGAGANELQEEIRRDYFRLMPPNVRQDYEAKLDEQKFQKELDREKKMVEAREMSKILGQSRGMSSKEVLKNKQEAERAEYERGIANAPFKVAQEEAEKAARRAWQTDPQTIEERKAANRVEADIELEKEEYKKDEEAKREIDRIRKNAKSKSEAEAEVSKYKMEQEEKLLPQKSRIMILDEVMKRWVEDKLGPDKQETAKAYRTRFEDMRRVYEDSRDRYNKMIEENAKARNEDKDPIHDASAIRAAQSVRDKSISQMNKYAQEYDTLTEGVEVPETAAKQEPLMQSPEQQKAMDKYEKMMKKDKSTEELDKQWTSMGKPLEDAPHRTLKWSPPVITPVQQDKDGRTSFTPQEQEIIAQSVLGRLKNGDITKSDAIAELRRYGIDAAPSRQNQQPKQ